MAMESILVINISSDVVDRLKHVKDRHLCLLGLRTLQTALEQSSREGQGDGYGVNVWQQLADTSPDMEEFVLLWDNVAKSQDEELQILMLRTYIQLVKAAEQFGQHSAKVLEGESRSRNQTVDLKIYEVALGLFKTFVSSHIKPFYYHLGSKRPQRVRGALLLLAEICKFSSKCAEELVRSFDFSLAVLPGLARPNRQRKDETTLDFRCRIEKEWGNLDPLRKPTRAAFVSWALSLLTTSNMYLLASVLRLKPLIQGTMHYLSSDPAEIQIEILETIRKYIVVESENENVQHKINVDKDRRGRPAHSESGLNRATRSTIWTEATLRQLSKIAIHYEGNKTTPESNNTAPVERAALLSHTILCLISTHAENGLSVTDSEASAFRLVDAHIVQSLPPLRKRLLRWMNNDLKPFESVGHWILFRDCATHDPALAAASLLVWSSSYTLAEPKADASWFVHAGLLCLLLSIVNKIPIGLSNESRRNDIMIPTPRSNIIQACLLCAAPEFVSRTSLSRGIQHKNKLVKHSSISIVAHMLQNLGILLDDIAKAYDEASLRSEASAMRGWEILLEYIQQRCRSILPDVQPLIAQIASADKAQFGLISRKQKLDDKQLHFLDENHSDYEEKNISDCYNSDWFIVDACLQSIYLWRTVSPGVFNEGNIDVEKLLPANFPILEHSMQLRYLQILSADMGNLSCFCRINAFTGENMQYSYVDTLNSTTLMAVLKARSRNKPSSDSGKAAQKWLINSLLSTGIFGDNREEPLIWIESISCNKNLLGIKSPHLTLDQQDETRLSDYAAEFLTNAVSILLRRLEEFEEIEYNFLGSLQSPRTPFSCSLLVFCALRQLIRILASAKRSDEEKHAVTLYLSCCISFIVLQQSKSEAKHFARFGLLVLALEAARLERSDGEGKKEESHNSEKKKRKLIDKFGSEAREHIFNIRKHPGFCRMMDNTGRAKEVLEILIEWLNCIQAPTKDEMFVGNSDLDGLSKRRRKDSSQLQRVWDSLPENTSSNEKSNLKTARNEVYKMPFGFNTALWKSIFMISSEDDVDASMTFENLEFTNFPLILFFVHMSDEMKQKILADNLVTSNDFKFCSKISSENMLRNLRMELKASSVGCNALLVRQTLPLLPIAATPPHQKRKPGSISPLSALLSCLKESIEASTNYNRKDKEKYLNVFRNSEDILAALTNLFSELSVCGSWDLQEDNGSDNTKSYSQLWTKVQEFVVFFRWITETALKSRHDYVSPVMDHVANWIMDRIEIISPMKSVSYELVSLLELLRSMLSSVKAPQDLGQLTRICKSLVAVLRVALSGKSREIDSKEEIDSKVCQSTADALVSILSHLSAKEEIQMAKEFDQEVCVLVKEICELIINCTSRNSKQWKRISPRALYPEDCILSYLLKSPSWKQTVAAGLEEAIVVLLEDRLLSLLPERGESCVLILEQFSTARDSFPTILSNAMDNVALETQKILKRRALSLFIPCTLAYLKCEKILQQRNTEGNVNSLDNTVEESKTIFSVVNTLLKPILSWICAKQSKSLRKVPPDNVAMEEDLLLSATLLQKFSLPCIRLLLQLKFESKDCSSTEFCHDVVMRVLNSSSFPQQKLFCPVSKDAKTTNLIEHDLSPALVTKILFIGIVFEISFQKLDVSNCTETSRYIGILLSTIQYLCQTALSCLTASLPMLPDRVEHSSNQERWSVTSPADDPEGVSLNRLDIILLSIFDVLDSSIGNAIAELPDKYRTSRNFAELAICICSILAPAVLQFRGRDWRAVKMIRRLCAALLPQKLDIMEDSSVSGESEEIAKEDTPISNPEVSNLARKLFTAIVKQQGFIHILQCKTGCPAPVPSSVMNTVTGPLNSVVAIGEIEPCAHSEDPSYTSEAALLKKEYCELLETLVDICHEFESSQDSIDNREKNIILEERLLYLALASYGASMSIVDRATLSLILTLNHRLWSGRFKRDENENDSDKDSHGCDNANSDNEAMQALFNGPIAKLCFAWGVNSSKLFELIKMQTASSSSPGDLYLRNVVRNIEIDPLRCALTVCHFPEWQKLTAHDDDLEINCPNPEYVSLVESSDSIWSADLIPNICSMTYARRIFNGKLGEQDSVCGVQLGTLPHSAAAYDPRIILPFSVMAMQKKLLPLRSFIEMGLLSVSLRATSAEDHFLRSAAYEVIALVLRRISASSVRGEMLCMGHSDLIPAAKDLNASEIDKTGTHQNQNQFKLGHQMLLLLTWLRNSLERPFMRLPTCHGVFAAEAALALCYPACPMYPSISKLLVKSCKLNTMSIPLFHQLLHAGSMDGNDQRLWFLRLLLQGLRSNQDVSLYQKYHVFQHAMSTFSCNLHKPSIRSSSLKLICRSVYIPRLVRILSQGPGLVIWLARATVYSMDQTFSEGFGDTATWETAYENWKESNSLRAIRRLYDLVHMRASKGYGHGIKWQGAEDFAMVCKHLLSYFSNVTIQSSDRYRCHPYLAHLLAEIWVTLMQLCFILEKRIGIYVFDVSSMRKAENSIRCLLRFTERDVTMALRQGLIFLSQRAK